MELFYFVMNLIIDAGNTLIKLAIFKQDKLLSTYRVKNKEAVSFFSKIRNEYTITHVIVSIVGKFTAKNKAYLEKYYSVFYLNSKTKVPFTNCYKTPNTLGKDRIALASAAAKQYPKKNVLIIDAGTCITYDFLDAKNNYLGGAIAPGIRMRYNALHQQTANLPLLETKLPENFIGNSTQMCMHVGVIYGILGEIEAVIQKYTLTYKDLTVILTGGDANFLSKQLKSSIFANPNFLLEGLNYILQYNIKK